MHIDFVHRYPNFKQVDSKTFQEWLEKGSADYTRDAWGGGIRYEFRHNQEVFAVDLENGTVLVDPKLLEKPKEEIPLIMEQAASNLDVVLSRRAYVLIASVGGKFRVVSNVPPERAEEILEGIRKLRLVGKT